jgi:hypothetical protein
MRYRLQSNWQPKTRSVPLPNPRENEKNRRGFLSPRRFSMLYAPVNLFPRCLQRSHSLHCTLHFVLLLCAAACVALVVFSFLVADKNSGPAYFCSALAGATNLFPCRTNLEISDQSQNNCSQKRKGCKECDHVQVTYKSHLYSSRHIGHSRSH